MAVENEKIVDKEIEDVQEEIPAFNGVELRETDQVPLANRTVGSEAAELQEETRGFMVHFPGEMDPVPLTDQTVWMEIDEVLKTMLGKEKYFAMLNAQPCVFQNLLMCLQKSLRDLQGKMKKEMENSFLLMKDGGDFEGTIDQIYFPLRLKLQKTGKPILPELRSEVIKILEESQATNHFEVTLEEVKNVWIKNDSISLAIDKLMLLRSDKETSKWINFYLKEEGEKVVKHPQYLANIPRDWRIDHLNRPDVTCYPSDTFYESMASYTGLEVKQVQEGIFQNNRKRKAKIELGSTSDLLKRHATPEAQGILRKWEADNPGKKWEAKNPGKEPEGGLMKATGMTEKQIVYWFGNHAPGRENRNKSKEVTQP